MASDKDIDTPSASYREKPDDPDNYVLVYVEIPGLKKKVFKSEASNADINLSTTESSFVLDVVLNPGVEKGKKNAEKVFQYKVNRLPGYIDKEETTHKVKKESQVEVHLKKKVPCSWASDLDGVGLDVEGD